MKKLHIANCLLVKFDLDMHGNPYATAILDIYTDVIDPIKRHSEGTHVWVIFSYPS